MEKKLAAGKKLANNKSPGLNNIPPDNFKALSYQNIDTPHSYLNPYWQEKADFIKWHKGQIVPVPKSELMTSRKSQLDNGKIG